MTQFDQRRQRVSGNQYNVGRDINFGAVQTPVDLIAELEKLKGELVRARASGLLNEEAATDAEYQVTKAVQQAKKPEPDKKTILDHLNTAKSLIEGFTAVSGLVTSIFGAIEVVQKLFS
jgi:hypothetical protein